MNALPSFASLRPAGLTQAAIGGVGGMRPPHISIDQNRFSLVDSTGNVKQLPPLIVPGPQGQQAIVALDVVLIDANPKPSKIYWGAKPYSPNSADPPVCYSDNGVAPSAASTSPQSPTCVACPHNAIGSAVSKFTGANIKACQDFKKLAAVVPGQGVDEIEFLMQIKPGSFKNWSSYINWLKGQKTSGGAAPELFDVVTRMSFESQGVLKFEPVAAVAGNAALEAQIVAAWQKGTTGEMVGKNDVPFAGQIAPPAQGPQPMLAPPPAPLAAPYLPQNAVPVQQAYAQMAAPVQPVNRTNAGQMPVHPVNTEPSKRTRRTKAEMEAARAQSTPFVSGLQQVPSNGAPVPVSNDTDIPPFLRRTQPVEAPQQAPAPNTGLAQPQPMPVGLAAQLDKAFEFPK